MPTNSFVYWLDGLGEEGGGWHLTITILRNGGGAFANKHFPQGRAFNKFFQVPGVCPGGCSRLELTRTFRSKPYFV